MVRSALQQRAGTIGRSPRRGALLVPAASVVVGSTLALLPLVSENGWAPDFGFLTLIAWRLLRADAWPAWWSAPLGLANDLLVGSPVGQSVALWSLVMLLLDLADRRTLWRDYWIEWLLAALLLFASEAFEWRVAAWSGARVPFTQIVPPLLVSIVVFPLVAGIVGALDRWRLGR
ncbi:MAG: rod shape-determining protein MreD [Pseudomonadota bacterium]|nr:rod shape-determining protein MreD [Pseudomonadota bacterium]